MPRSKRNRRSTFSNIAALEPHGTHAPDLESSIPGLNSSNVVADGASDAGPSNFGDSINRHDSVTGDRPRPSLSTLQSSSYGGDDSSSRLPRSPGGPSPLGRNQRPGSYFQITGDSVHLIDADDESSLFNGNDDRQIAGASGSGGRRIDTGIGGDGFNEDGNASSFDSNDFMDHRRSTFANESSSGPVPYRPVILHQHHPRSSSSITPQQPNHSSKYSSPSLVERLVKGRRSLSQLPLINGNPNTSGNRSMDYTSLGQGDDEFAIAVADDMSSIDEAEHSRGGRGGNNGRLGVVGGFLDVNSDIESLNSKPSSRRGSDTSSLDDVCYPIDSPREIDSTNGGPKVWPDLAILTEFAEQELKELSATEAAASNRPVALEDFDVGGVTVSGYNGASDERPISPFTTGGTLPDRGRYAVNEAAETGGRLRPRRVVPWAKNGGTTTTAGVGGIGNTAGSFGTGFEGLNRPGVNFDRHIPGVDEKAAMDFRFTYFNEDMEATIHSPTISGLLQPGQSFASLFPPRLAPHSPFESAAGRGSTPLDSENDLNATSSSAAQVQPPHVPTIPAPSLHPTVPGGTPTMSPRFPSIQSNDGNTLTASAQPSVGRQSTISANNLAEPTPFWLDVLNPTEEEMKVLSKTFGIHPLTTEDIFLGETREKVELFRNYYLVCFRSIDTNYEKQKSRRTTMGINLGDTNETINNNSFSRTASRSGGYSELYGGTRDRRGSSSKSISSKQRGSRHRTNELKPLNMYIIVFHEGVLSFHFAPTAHPINVRRRARLLRDYLTVSSDWISYALIDDITDGFAPLIEAIEDDVNLIEDAILKMHSGETTDSDDDSEDEKRDSNRLQDSDSESSRSTSLSNRHMWKKKGDMLRQIGECRKRVMSLLRLLGNKADVIKGFSKRCNEQWEVAPRNEIGLYLGDIQDHIITMVQSLNHYEKLLARSHSNYLAQINIDMTRANNDMNDVLGRITVLGTIVVPMNIITGLWGMNVIVPGQHVDNLNWFWCICVALVAFALLCFWAARRIYKIA